MGRHFRRLAIWDAFHREQHPREMPAALSQRLVAASRADTAELLRRLGTQPEGLSRARAAQVRRRVGSNEVGHDKPMPWWQHLWYCYSNPFNLLLTLLAAVSYATDDMKATVVISAMVLLSTVLRFVQESRSSKAADALKAMVSNQATVMRSDSAGRPGDGAAPPGSPALPTPRQEEVPMKDLVPGDIVVLSAGDMIPADLRVLTAKDLFVSQSAMTG